jgi:membrane protein YdbS with pleckstrin-like domain
MKVLAPETKQCPFCGEMIRIHAIKCRFCAEFLDTDEANALKANFKSNARQPEIVLFAARPSLWAIAPAVIKALFFVALAVLLLEFPLERTLINALNLRLTLGQTEMVAEYRIIAGVGLIILVSLILLLKVFRLKMTHYTISPDRIEWSRGILDRKVDNLDMFRVIDLNMRRTIFDCIVGVGTVGLITTDKTDPEFRFQKIRDSRKLYDIIKRASLEADKRSSVVHLE